jgi:hypothetical protein
MDLPVPPKAEAKDPFDVKTITVKAFDGEGRVKTFIVPEKTARISAFIASSLESSFRESSSREIVLKEIPASTVARVVEYMIYKEKYDGVRDRPVFKIEASEALDLLQASNFLGL